MMNDAIVSFNYIDDLIYIELIMPNSRIRAIIMTVISFGAVEETFRIFTSGDPDIASNRLGLLILGVLASISFIILAIYFWIKDSTKP